MDQQLTEIPFPFFAPITLPQSYPESSQLRLKVCFKLPLLYEQYKRSEREGERASIESEWTGLICFSFLKKLKQIFILSK
jgi:hypothetical protein